jgi:hypothetical protein
VLSILALNPKLPLHVAASYMSNTLKGLSDSTENVRGLVLSAMTDIEAITASKNSQTQVGLSISRCPRRLCALSVNVQFRIF